MTTALGRLGFGASASASCELSGSALSTLVKHFGVSRGVYTSSSLFAKKASKKVDTSSTDEVHTHSTEIATGINIKKGGEDPTLKPDADYPDWLWTLASPEKSLGELEKEVEAAKLTGELDVMAVGDIKRLVKLRRRAKIKANNQERAK